MTRASHTQTSFTTGEISPRLLGRTDLNQYQNGLAKASNAIIYPHGMIARRPGTKFVAYAKDEGARLAAFQFNDDQAYVFEFGGTYVRFYRDGFQITEDLTSVSATASGATATYTKSGHRLVDGDFVTISGMSDSDYDVSGYITNVTSTTWDMTLDVTPAGSGSGGTATVPLDIESPWAGDDVAGLRWDQSADVLFVCHPRYQPRTISRTGADVFELSAYSLDFGPMKLQKQRTNIRVRSAIHDATVVDGTVYKDGQNADDYQGVKPTEHFVILIRDDTMTFDHDGADGTTGEDIGKLVKFRKGTTRSYVYAQIYQTISPTRAYAVVIQNGANTDKTDWNFQSGGGTNINARTNTDDAWFIGEFYGAIDEQNHNGKSISSATWASGTLTVTTEQKHCMDRATTEQVTITGLESDTDVNGTYTATPTGTNTFEVTTADPGTITTSAGFARFPSFLTNLGQEGGETANYPSVPSFFQQRLFFARTPDHVNRIYGSQTGDFGNFEDSEVDAPFDVLDTSALVYTIDDGEITDIRWLRPVSKGLVIGTAGAEYVLSGSSTNESLTPSNVRALRQTDFGSDSGLVDVLSGRSILFAHRSGTRLIELAYSFQADQQVGSDVSLISEHLLKPGILEIASQEVPVQIIWIVLDNGDLVAFTYEREQEVFGWATGSFGGGGQAESVAVIPEGDEDAPWFVVNRGGTRSIEVMQPPIDIDTDQTDLWYVDSGLRLDTRNTESSDTLTYAGGQDVNDTGTLTASGHTPFAGTSADVGERFRLFESESIWYDFEITAAGTTTSATVKLLTDGLPDSLESAATDQWARLTETVSGLEHLEGETVSVFADGGALPDHTVSSGEITLDRKVSNVLVGHGYASRFKSLPIRTLQFFADTRGKTQTLYNVELNVWRSLGGEVDFGGKAVEIQNRVPEEAFSVPVSLNSGVFDVSAESAYTSEQSFNITTSNPLPLNLLSIVYEMDINQGY